MPEKTKRFHVVEAETAKKLEADLNRIPNGTVTALILNEMNGKLTAVVETPPAK